MVLIGNCFGFVKIGKNIFLQQKIRPDEASVIPKLATSLSATLGGLLNQHWMLNGSWPTIGEAVESNRRIFAIVRTEYPVNGSAVGYIPEILIKNDKPVRQKLDGEKAITVLTTFKSM